MDRRLKITLQVQENVVEGRTQGFRLTAAASEPTNMETHIFLYQIGEPDPITGDRASRFVAVASPSDIEQYPETTPGTDDRFYRLSSIDLIFRSSILADACWEKIASHIEELIATLKLMDDMGTAEDVWFGDDIS